MALFAECVCLPELLSAQNRDGGWGFRPGSASRVEPTCWVLLSLARGFDSGSEVMQRGYAWLRASQLPDGSWPASPAQNQGCWATSLACLALQPAEQSSAAVARGVSWLCAQWPGEGGLWWRIRASLRPTKKLYRQNDHYRGWSWTPGTSSWVEPTSLALILLSNTPEEQLPSQATRRVRLAEAMLLDRMCPGGGWNSGNPEVYGVPGEPQIIPTVWALFALRHHSARPENRASLDWLQQHLASAQGAASLALGHLCLELYQRPAAPVDAALENIHRENAFLRNVVVLAWVLLAMGPVPCWLRDFEVAHR